MSKIVVLSLGQVADSSIEASYNAFADILSEQGKWFPQARVRMAYAADMLHYGTINAYKRGDIEFDEFRTRFNNQLGVEIDKKRFKTAWNAMCTMSEESLDAFEEVITLQQQHPFELCIVSVTNEEQYAHIFKQWQSRMADIEDNQHIHVTTSCNHHTLDLRTLAKETMVDVECDKADHQVISLHNQLTEPGHLGLKQAEFAYHPFDTRVPGANLANTIKQVLGIKEQVVIASNTTHSSDGPNERTLLIQEVDEAELPLYGFAANEKKRQSQRDACCGCVIS